MNVRVLLVDHHADVRIRLAHRLRRDSRVELVGSASGVEEAERILAAGAEADVVLLDIQGIDGGGLAKCRALRGVTDAAVVIFTSYLTDELWRAAKEAGAADYLLKHIDTDSLCREVVRLAKEHRAGPRPRGSPLPEV